MFRLEKMVVNGALIVHLSMFIYLYCCLKMAMAKKKKKMNVLGISILLEILSNL